SPALPTPSAHHFRSSVFFPVIRPPPTPTLFPYTTLFRSRESGSRPWIGCTTSRTRKRRSPASPGRACPTRKSALSCSCRRGRSRSEEHTSELQSLTNLVCRLLLEKKNKKDTQRTSNKDHA